MSDARPPHRFAVFSLKPLNKRAENVVNHPSNSHLVSTLNDGTNALDVGFHIRSRSNHTIAVLGRGCDVDIFVEGSSISKIQCSFEVDSDTNMIMLYDRSHGQTTQLLGENAIPFEHKRPRKVLVQNKLNTEVGMGGSGRNLVRFELKWHRDLVETMEQWGGREKGAQECLENPRLTRTIDESETVLPSEIGTRLHTPGLRQFKMRYIKVAQLGTGQFGTVHKAINVDTAKYMAVKILRLNPMEPIVTRALKREVEILSQTSHVGSVSDSCFLG